MCLWPKVCRHWKGIGNKLRIKTFLATYILFLAILFSSIGIVSVYLTNNQMNILKDKSISEYQTISAILLRDIGILYSQSLGAPSMDFADSVDIFIRGYARYYNNYGIELGLVDTSVIEDNTPVSNEITITSEDGLYFIYISGNLPEPFQFFRLDYHADITENITQMRVIQQNFLLFSIIFSIITAFALYAILTRIFKPISVISGVSKKIAGGCYGERISIKGKNELSSMAADFNRMAEVIETQILKLEDEALRKQQFIDNFAHEIKTPLTSIYGYAEYIQKAPLNEMEIIDSTESILNEANHMKKIANSLLSLATLRNYVPVKVKIFIPLLFDNLHQTLKDILTEKGIKLVCDHEAEVLVGQEDLIKSLLLNLCYNAIKYCSPGEGVILLKAYPLGGKVVLSVGDNGCGIPEGEIDKLVEPFYRVDKARSRADGGVGLGLTLCKQIAEVHGAEMMIESTVNVGTTVKITFTNS